MSRFSLIIPTREREDTFVHALRSATRESEADFEIIVSDNASRDGTRAVVEAARDPRIRYFNTGRRVSMTENWEFGLSHARGDWIGFMGDDDAILPGCIERVSALAAKYDVEALRCTPAAYSWPSYVNDETGRLAVPVRKGLEIRDGRPQLARVMDGASYKSLPMIYAGGFARREAINRARGADGRFFGSSQPDVYSAIALAHVIGRYAYSHEPLMISGVSSHSTGADFFAGGAGPFGQYWAEPNLPFHDAVPLHQDGRPPRSLQAIVFECYNQASDRLPGLPAVAAARQLALILADARDGPAIRSWAPSFARRHGIPVPRAAIRRAIALTRAQARRAFPDYWRDATAPDVATASEIAACLLRRPRSRLVAAVANLARVATRG